MEIQDQHKVKHLFLLVGENPLPNYVAARTLLKEGGKVYLVFTNQTEEQKNCLVKRLNKRLKDPNIGDNAIDLGSNESNAHEIRKNIQKAIESINDDSIGLNYTGGTKAMAVHAYRAIKELKPEAVFSYLDPRRLKMCIDRENDDPFFRDVPLELSLRELFTLHNNNHWSAQEPPQSKPCLPEAAAKLAEFYQNKKLADSWKNWCKNKLRPQTKTKDQWKEEKELQSITIRLGGLDSQLQDFLRSELDASADALSLKVTQKKGFKSLTQVCEWLDGIWLENYVLWKVQEIQEQFDIKESMMSFRIKDSKEPWSKWPRFEFDVAFIKGYQLFAISCTTDYTKPRCKQKLFEAHLRGRQLGGDEARVALVCCYDEDSGKIKKDMRFAIDDKKIEVFGLGDLLNLGDKIADWIDAVENQTKA